MWAQQIGHAVVWLAGLTVGIRNLEVVALVRDVELREVARIEMQDELVTRAQPDDRRPGDEPELGVSGCQCIAAGPKARALSL